MTRQFTDTELEAYLDEGLPEALMGKIEQALRDQAHLSERLAAINGRRDLGMHTLGAIWRRHRLSCPTREQLGSYVMGILANDLADFIKFHLEVSGCRYCNANLTDLKSQESQSNKQTDVRRRRYFESSAGYLKDF